MLILHIGLPTTGTTLLQHWVFARAPGVTFVNRTRGGEEAAAVRDFRLYARVNPLLALRYGWRLRRRLNAMGSGGKPVLLTEENISVRPLHFWRGSGATPEGLAKRIALLARGLDPDLRRIRLIVGIRRQDHWLASRYAESSRHFPEFCQTDFDQRMRAIAAEPGLAGPMAWLDFRAMRDAFAATLGAESVHLVPLERIAADPAATVEGISRFLGLPLIGDRRHAAALHRPRNRLSTGENIWRLRRAGDYIVLDPGLQTALRARFAASNLALADEMALGFEP
jgi:hypothetical protein